MITLLLTSLLTTIHLSFSPLDVEIKGDGYPFLKDGVLGFDVGKPAIPGYIVHFIPNGNANTAVNYKKPIILGEYDISPLQPPAILSQKEVRTVEPDREIYESDKEYPGKTFKRLKGGYITGKKVKSILIYPLQYKPEDRQLILYQDVDIEGDLFLLDRTPLLPSYSKSEQPGYEYLVITSEHLAPCFQPLAEWKTKKGVPARIKTVEEIYNNYDGRDNQERIRQFIKSQHQDSGVVWVLLGGDVDAVPSRTAFAFQCGADFHPDDEDSLQCDLYYSDLDGNWDFDGDGVFGEIEDSVDMIADVFVGRAPVNTPQDVQNFVTKLLTYEKSPPPDYLTDALFFAMVLWGDPEDPYYTDGGVHKDMIDNQFMPSHFYITKLYERDETGDASEVLAEMNKGKNIMNHDGHGWIDIISMNPGRIRNEDMDGLTNGNKLGILCSIGCWTGAFDYDCIGEHFINARNGGGVAYIGNSRYGWGSPGNPGYGYSDVFDNKFFEAIFVDSLINIGTALAYSKAYYAPLAGYGNVYRWCEYEINLFGDPQMPVWTATPREITVIFPDSIPLGELLLYVQVFSTDGSPIEGATVTFSGDDYKRGITDPSGETALSISTGSTGWGYITVSGMNILPYEDSVLIYGDGVHLSPYEHYTEKDFFPGEMARLFCIVKNYGSLTSESREVILSTDDTLSTITDTIDTLSPIPPLGIDTLEFDILISGNAKNGHIIRFSLIAPPTAGLLPLDIGEFTEMVKTPILALKSVHKDSPVAAGDSGFVSLILKNVGYGIARAVTVSVSTPDTLIQFIESEVYIDSMAPDSSVAVSFKFSVSLDCPIPYLATCIVDFGSVDTFVISIGNYGLSDDFESDDDWYATGDWHIDEEKSYSPSQSFYCGDSLTRKYRTGACDSLVSPPFYIDENSSLSFWHWFDMAGLEDLEHPGCDGLYVGVIDSSEFYLLDFIGSGGALDSLYNSCPFWYKSTYDLSFIPAGREVQILFKFISNSSRCGKGWYIDDVSVQPSYLEVEEEVPEFALFQNFPNPFRTETVIGYRLSVFGEQFGELTAEPLSRTVIGEDGSRLMPYALRIYDLSGRLVKSFVISHQALGGELMTNDQCPMTITWDGRDDSGKLLPGGVYFYRLEAGGLSATKKLIFLR
ncbi:MAG: C25 family cysteine peptidase [candidate division WOR-3 bacterium]|nr:C25 family cysteine peptidase [candidate division WOR-3 bacterium]